MGDTEYDTIDSTFNKVLEQLVTLEGFRYADLNLGDENEKGTRIVSLPLPHSESR